MSVRLLLQHDCLSVIILFTTKRSSGANPRYIQTQTSLRREGGGMGGGVGGGEHGICGKGKFHYQ